MVQESMILAAGLAASILILAAVILALIGVRERAIQRRRLQDACGRAIWDRK